MDNVSTYIPQDRRRALAQGQTLPEATQGAALFADISGFTPLTDALIRYYGPRRGVDELTRRLNAVYSALIAEVDRFGGSVIGFSGDAITCWFTAAPDGDATSHANAAIATSTRTALASALAMQKAMVDFHTLTVGESGTAELAIKTAVAAGHARRFLVGDPKIQLIDVLAGDPLDRMAAAEQIAGKHELLVDAKTLALVENDVLVHAWRTDPQSGLRFAVIEGQHRQPEPAPACATIQPVHTDLARPWVLPAIYLQVQSAQNRFLAELRPATALFLRFSGLDFDNDPMAGARLDIYIRWVQSIVDRYEGALIQLTTGDKGSYLYAAFGAPIAHDDDCLRALAAAQVLRTPPATMPFITATQIGISQGIMRVGAYGSPSRQTYGVLGDETVVAARLMSQAAAGQILVSASVAEVAGNHYQLGELGQIKLKGKPESQPVWAVLARLGPVGKQLSKRYTAPLVGRSSELATLRAALAAVGNGQGRVLRIEGSAGVGKSHLVATFAQEAAAQGFEIITATCQSTSQDIAYFSGRQLARSLLHVTDAMLSEAAQIDQVTKELATRNPNWLLRLPLLGDLLGISIPDNPTTATFDPRLRQEALVSLIVDIVQTWASQHPLVLLFEDIHWMDEASQGILLALGRVVQTAPLLLIVVQRPPVREDERFLAEVAALPAQTHLSLAELAPDGLAALVRSRLLGEIAPLALALIQRLTQGNPFFAEELVDALRDAHHLILEDGVWTLAHDLVEKLHEAGCLRLVAGEWTLAPDAPLAAVDLGVPGTVQGIVLSRLDRLPEPAKLTLKVASVIGAIFEHQLLVQAHPLPDAQEVIGEHTALFLAREFVRLETPEPRLTYLFRHNITQEVVYQSLLEDQRHELHLSVANALSQLHPEKIEDLAFHYTNCNLEQRAVRDLALHYLDAAGQRAKREYANETALNYFNRALAIEGRWPWLKAKIEVLHILGRREEERATLGLLEAAPNAPLFDSALLWGEYYEAISDYGEAKRAMQKALAASQQIGNAEGEARCLARLGVIAWSQGDYEEAEQCYMQALAVITDEEHFRDEKAEVHWGLGLVFRRQGKLEEAQHQFEQDLALNRQSGNLQNEARALNAIGHVALLKRNYRAAVEYYRQALEIRQTIGDREGVGAGLLSLAQGYGSLGDYGKAESLLHDALKIQRAINNRWWEMLTHTELGILYLMIGDLARAEQSLNGGLQLSQEIGDESGQAYLLCNLGQVVREQGDLTRAESILHQSLQLAVAQGDVQLEAICYSDLALVSLRAGRFDEVITRANTSLAKFRMLESPLSTTTDLTSLAAAHLALGHRAQARAYVDETLQILAGCQGEGPDFPHRDYWVCYQVLHTLGDATAAQQALHEAFRLLMQQADKISNPAMRKTYLESAPGNREIVAAMQKASTVGKS